nr:uncharacterized protein LOC111769046 [Equus caballus]
MNNTELPDLTVLPSKGPPSTRWAQEIHLIKLLDQSRQQSYEETPKCHREKATDFLKDMQSSGSLFRWLINAAYASFLEQRSSPQSDLVKSRRRGHEFHNSSLSDCAPSTHPVPGAQNSTQEIFEELHDGFDFSPSLVKGQEQQAASSILCRSENSTQEMFEELCVGFDFSPSLVKGQEQQATSSILCRSEEPTLSVAEARTMLTLKAGAVQKVVGCLQPSFHGRSISVTTFPCVYQAFYPTPQVLDQLLQSALSPIWGPRPQENSQDMWQMLRHSRINLTLAYLQDLLAWLSPEAPGHPSSPPGGPFPGH